MKKQVFLINPTAKHILIGVLSGAAVSLLSMVLCAVVLTMKDFSPSIATPLANVALAVGAFVSGIVCTLMHKSKGLILGSISGLVLFMVVTIIALFVNSGDITFNTLLRFVFMLILSAAGGVIGVNKSAKHKMI